MRLTRHCFATGLYGMLQCGRGGETRFYSKCGWNQRDRTTSSLVWLTFISVRKRKDKAESVNELIRLRTKKTEYAGNRGRNLRKTKNTRVWVRGDAPKRHYHMNIMGDALCRRERKCRHGVCFRLTDEEQSTIRSAASWSSGRVDRVAPRGLNNGYD